MSNMKSPELDINFIRSKEKIVKKIRALSLQKGDFFVHSPEPNTRWVYEVMATFVDAETTVVVTRGTETNRLGSRHFSSLEYVELCKPDGSSIVDWPVLEFYSIEASKDTRVVTLKKVIYWLELCFKRGIGMAQVIERLRELKGE